MVKYKKLQRKAALRCSSANRTVSTKEVCVLACMPQAELIAEGRTVVYRAIKMAMTVLINICTALVRRKILDARTAIYAR